MDVSIVLCTWNNCERLSVTLDTIASLKIPPSVVWELVIVNNNSTDNTPAIISSFSDKLPINYILEPKQGLSHARNAGLMAATGKLLIFTDDDVKPCTDWLGVFWHAYQLNPEDSFWGGPIESDFESVRINRSVLQYAPPSVKGLDLGDEVRFLGHKEYLISANWACPSLALKEIGGFDVGKGLNPTSGRMSIGEETDLMDRLKQKGFKSVYLPQAKISHFVPKSKSSLKHIASRSRAWGYYCGEKESLSAGSGREFMRVPLWLYRSFSGCAMQFFSSLLKLRIDYAAYLKCYHFFGYMEAARKLSKEGRLC